MNALLELRDVEARHGEVRPLRGVSLRVDGREIVAVLGANGAGKTTTLRATSGTVRRAGTVAFAAHSIARRFPEATAPRGVAHVPEGRGTFTELSIWRRVNEEDAPAVLVVEQNATLVLDTASRAFVLEAGRVALVGDSVDLRAHESVGRPYLGY